MISWSLPRARLSMVARLLKAGFQPKVAASLEQSTMEPNVTASARCAGRSTPVSERRPDRQREVAPERGAFADAVTKAQQADTAPRSAQPELLRELLHLEQVAANVRCVPVGAGHV